jgi:hypothetical protein
MIQLSIAVVTASASGLFRAARCHDAALAVARRLHLPAPRRGQRDFAARVHPTGRDGPVYELLLLDVLNSQLVNGIAGRLVESAFST